MRHDSSCKCSPRRICPHHLHYSNYAGGGNNALHLKKAFSHVTLTDASAQMLAVSRLLNQDCEHLQGDMRTLRLDRTFDAVFIHDAIDYKTTLEHLEQAILTAFAHCEPGGVALLVPDYVRETFRPSTDHGGEDGDGRALRYLEWTFDPDESDTMYTTEYAYLLREGNEPAQVENEVHTCGLFARKEWLLLLRKAGFDPTVVRDEDGRDLFVARKRRDRP